MTRTEISADDLASALESGEITQVLDVRAPQRVAEGQIEGAAQFRNLPNSRLFAAPDLGILDLDSARPVAVVCDRGTSSRMTVEFLRRRGFTRAVSVAGGMGAWALVVRTRPLPPPPGFDALLQLDRPAKGSLAYLFVAAGEALLVDPGRNVDPYLEAVEAAGARLVGVADTHCHADYLSSGPFLARELGIPYYLHPADAVDPYEGRPARIASRPLLDGEELGVGGATLRVEHFPGHTEGSVVLRAGDAAATGDFVFVRGVGRPDLAGKTDEWTGKLWASLERARATWPDDLRVLPAHYAGADERAADGTVAGVFGPLRRANEPLAMRDPAAFAAWVQARCGSFPEAYRRIKQANLGLVEVDEDLAEELETGKNQCAVG
jgi:glyoxylase-like metal-dependent hydrolase (beta-lactamase superfamily II)